MFLPLESPKPVLKQKESQIIIRMHISEWNHFNALRNKQLDHETLIDQDSSSTHFYPNMGYLFHRILFSVSYVAESHDIALQPHFSWNPFWSKRHQKVFQSVSPNYELREMRFIADSFANLPRITNELPKTRVSLLNNVETPEMRSSSQNCSEHICKQNVSPNIQNVFFGLESLQTHRNPRD